MDSLGYLDVFGDRSAALLESALDNLDAAVPSCPGWSVADLVTHTASTWGWAAAIVRSGTRDQLPSPPEGVGGAELVAWAGEQSRGLSDVLKEADPEADCRTFGLPRSALFWFRRQALETAVHAWDAQNAAANPESIDPELAGDGIDEFLAVMLPRQLQRESHSWTGQSVHLHRTDGDGEWMITLGPDGALSTEPTHGEGDVTLQGPASALYLWCMNRVPTADLELTGDGAVAEQWTATIAF